MKRAASKIVLFVLAGGLLSGCATVSQQPTAAQLLREQRAQGLCTGNHTCNDYKPPKCKPLVAYVLVLGNLKIGV